MITNKFQLDKMFEYGGKENDYDFNKRGSSANWKDDSEFASPSVFAKIVNESHSFSASSFNGHNTNPFGQLQT